MVQEEQQMMIRTPDGQPWGTIEVRKFSEPRHHAIVFNPTSGSPQVLGFGVRWNVLDPHQIVRTLQPEYTLKHTRLWHLGWSALLLKTDDPGIQDSSRPLPWDRVGERRLFPAILVSGSLKKGRAVHLVYGLFRTICVNGLFSGIFQQTRVLSAEGLRRLITSKNRSVSLYDDGEQPIRMLPQDTLQNLPPGVVPRRDGVLRLIRRIQEVGEFIGREPATVMEVINWSTPPFSDVPARHYSTLDSLLRLLVLYSLFQGVQIRQHLVQNLWEAERQEEDGEDSVSLAYDE